MGKLNGPPWDDFPENPRIHNKVINTNINGVSIFAIKTLDEVKTAMIFLAARILSRRENLFGLADTQDALFAACYKFFGQKKVIQDEFGLLILGMTKIMSLRMSLDNVSYDELIHLGKASIKLDTILDTEP